MFQRFFTQTANTFRNWGPGGGRGRGRGQGQGQGQNQGQGRPQGPGGRPSPPPKDNVGNPPPQQPPSQPQQPAPQPAPQPGGGQQQPIGQNPPSNNDGTLPIALVNHTQSSEVYVYITGLAIKNNNSWFLLRADGRTPYYPANPSGIGSQLAEDCAIKLEGPGQTRTVNIPQLAGGRIFVSIGGKLTFLLNPGPALVEPSVTNQADPNINTNWSFAEFTYNGPVYANISYVDFVGIPISMQLKTKGGATQTVPGMPANGLDTVCQRLREQADKDGVAGWRNLIVQNNGKNLRALSPNSSLGLRPDDFRNYWEDYVNQVWDRYQNSPLTIRTADNVLNTQGRVANSQFTIDNAGFAKPNTADVFSCNTGPFVTGQDQRRNVVIPHLCAAFNRSTLLKSDKTPANQDIFYKENVTNHYARILHEVAVDGRGYAFAYDDVNSAEGKDQSGFVNAPDPDVLTVTFGGL